MSEIEQKNTPLEHTGENLVKLTLHFDAQSFEAGLHQAYLKNRNKITLPGFRKGRVPRKVLEMQYGKTFFYDEALEILFPQAYEAALDEHDLDVVSRATVVSYEDAEGGGADVVVEVYVKPIIDVEDYTGIQYTKPVVEAFEEEVMHYLENDRQKNARIITVEGRPAKNGDIVNIDFEGFIEGEAFEGGKAQDFELTLGSKRFIDTFEEQIEGKNIGDEFDVNVTFPEDYNPMELASLPAVFKVKLLDIKEKEVPDIDDTFAQEVSEFDTLEEYKADIKAKIEERKKEETEREIEDQIALGLAERVTAEIPKPMIEAEVNRLISDFAKSVESQGWNFNNYLQVGGMDVPQLQLMYKDQAEQIIKSRLAIEAVVRQEGIEITDEERDKEIDALAENYRLERDKFLEAIGKDGLKGIEADIKAVKAMEKIKSVAIAVDRSVKTDEIEEEASE